MINLFTKFKVPACSRYEDMNGGAKWRNLGSLGQLWSSVMSPFDRAHTTSYSTLIETMHLALFSRYSQLFVESR